MHVDSREIYQASKDFFGKEVILEGWVRNHRKQKEFGFIDFSDGTYFSTIQVVYDNTLKNFEEIQKTRVGSSVQITGVVVESPKEGQEFEVQAKDILLVGDAAEDFPIQPKRHTREFLREVSYLRPRTNLFQAVFRIRSLTAYAIHTYLQERGYVYVHTPIITASDCEGAGEMFQVTTLDLDNLKKEELDYSKDFFGKKTSLTVSGQLQGEAFAMCYKKIYTFGPTFRAENSNTKTHASEFWMIEPEIAFCDLEGLMDLEEDFLKYIVSYVLEHAKAELTFLNQFVEKGLIEKLEKLTKSSAARVTHQKAIEILKQSGKDFEFEPKFGEDLAKEHEKYLTEEYFKSPVFVYDWPKDIKAFYMKQNEDGKTVRAVDLLVPESGELMGGSQREESYEKLVQRMNELKMPIEDMEWYLNLRRYGSVPHSGFGMGFERLLIYLTGVDNIRDVIPFPRTSKNCDF